MKLEEIFEECGYTGGWYGNPPKLITDVNFMGDTPLHTVCSWGDIDIIKFLIDAGADVKAKGDMGMTPIFNAIMGENVESIKLLISKGSDLKIKDETGLTAYEFAKNLQLSPNSPIPKNIIDILNPK